MSRIQPLPPDAVAQIHSSKHITSIEGVVLSLLENSLDSGATKVEVSVDFRRGACSIEDNGAGIPQSEFLENGGLGKSYHTSKFGADELHGHAGLFLSSLSALSFLAITSKHSGRGDQATVILHHGRPIVRHVPSLPSHEISISPIQGTRVTVRDLFGNMPVRVKQRDLLHNTDMGTEKIWQEMKRGIVSLLLAWPKSCAVRLKDEESEKIIMNISGYHPLLSAELTKKNLQHLRGREFKHDIRDSLALLFQARFVAHTSRQSWVPLSVSTETFTLDGIMCMEPSPHKNNQFISLGIAPCSSITGHGELHDVVNKIFARSSFGSEPDQSPTKKQRSRKDDGQTHDGDNGTGQQIQSRKGVDRWPMFIFRLKFKASHSHRAQSENPSDATIKQIIDILEIAATEWLKAHHFRPQKRKRKAVDGQDPPSATLIQRSMDDQAATMITDDRLTTGDLKSGVNRRRIIDLSGHHPSRPSTAKAIHSHAFDNWSRIKSATAMNIPDTQNMKRPATEPPESSHGSIEATEERLKSHDFNLPSIDIGQLGSHGSGPATRSKKHESLKDDETHLSSDDFGSFDDAAMLAVDGDDGKSCCNHCKNDRNSRKSAESATAGGSQDFDTIHWTDPISKQTLIIDGRTGTALPVQRNESSGDGNIMTQDKGKSGRIAIVGRLSSTGRPLSMAMRNATSHKPPEAKWLPGFLKDWNNPVFTGQNEEPVRKLYFDDPGIESKDSENRFFEDRLVRYFSAKGVSGTKQLSKLELQRAKVVRQVDGKFLLCKMPSISKDGHDNAGRSLVLIDQHAASERVILEKLIQEVCTPLDPSSPAAALITNTRQTSSIETTVLNRPLRFQISEDENEMLISRAQHFARWGILYDLAVAISQSTESQSKIPANEYKVIVRALPPGIAERCTLSPNILIELLRSEAWALIENPRRAADPPQSNNQTSAEVNSQNHEWLAQIGSCPKGLIEMLNSRACRSAIMFNDKLTLEDCATLLKDVGQCAFPFMCAHGRVSMVPVVELGAANDGVGLGDLMGKGLIGKRDDARNNVQAYKDWMKRR